MKTINELKNIKTAYSILIEVPLNNPMRTYSNVQYINEEVQKCSGEPNWFEDMADFERQIKEGFVVICKNGFCLMVDEPR